MDTLDWEDDVAVEAANFFFDTHMTAWNPRNSHLSTSESHHSYSRVKSNFGDRAICQSSSSIVYPKNKRSSYNRK